MPAFPRLRSLFRSQKFRLRRLQHLLDLALEETTQPEYDAQELFIPTADVLQQAVDAGSTDTTTAVIARLYKAAADSVRSDPAEIASADKPSTEECSICESEIPWDDFSIAQCEAGHIFSKEYQQVLLGLILTLLGRCGLSLLCIQEPGVSKHCNICGVLYLDESRFSPIIEAFESWNASATAETHGNQAPAHKDLPAAVALFAAFDCCVYCGGKFVGRF